MSESERRSSAASLASRGVVRTTQVVAAYLACVALIGFAQLRFERFADGIEPSSTSVASSFAIPDGFEDYSPPLRARGAFGAIGDLPARPEQLDEIR
jgi:hypothetical protein